MACLPVSSVQINCTMWCGLSILFLCTAVSHVLHVQVFQSPGFSGSSFFKVQVFQVPGFLGSRFFWVRVQGVGPGFRSSPESVELLLFPNSLKLETMLLIFLNSMKFETFDPEICSTLIF